MAAQIETSWIKTYRDNVELVLQQKNSRFRAAVDEDSYTGEGARPILRVGEAVAKKRTVRYAAMTPEELAITSRWVTPESYEIGPFLEDNLDRVRNGIELNGAYTQAGASAAMRGIDDQIITAATGSAKTGKDGASTTAFDTNMSISSGSTGMTVSKLLDMMQLFKENEIDLDEEKVYLALSSKQDRDLMKDIQVTSADFNPAAVLPNGRLSGYAGFEFIPSERLLTDGAGARRCIAWTPKGLHLGIWENPNFDINVRYDLSGQPIQVYGQYQIGATRTDEKRVGEILCAE